MKKVELFGSNKSQTVFDFVLNDDHYLFQPEPLVLINIGFCSSLLRFFTSSFCTDISCLFNDPKFRFIIVFPQPMIVFICLSEFFCFCVNVL